MADTSAPLRARLLAERPDLLPAEVAPPPPGVAVAADDLIVAPEQLPELARYLRDQLGYALLTNLSATDYLAAGLIEVVYHLVDIRGGAPAVIKVRAPREAAQVPSLTPWWPGADFQEREAYDLYGVQFSGHPQLRRIYMWEELEGHPMRKDFVREGDKYLGAEEGE